MVLSFFYLFKVNLLCNSVNHLKRVIFSTVQMCGCAGVQMILWNGAGPF